MMIRTTIIFLNKTRRKHVIIYPMIIMHHYICEIYFTGIIKMLNPEM